MNAAKLNRRGFLHVGASATAGLLVGFYLPERSPLAAQTPEGQAANAAKLNAWIHIAPDDSVTFMIHKVEMGQGTVTSLSQLLAEELECDWGKFRTEFPPVDPAFGFQGVVGSQSIRTSWDPLRKAGATAREMLVLAAAQTWGVDKSKCRAESGFVVNTSTNAGLNQVKLSYGKLADAAAKLPVPTNVALKDPKQFKLIGKSIKRLDTPNKVTGRTQFGIDTRRPGMVYAAIARCPVFGGKAASFDDTKAKAFPGVKQVVSTSRGVAVVADNTWSAIQGTKLLNIKWDEGPNANQSSANISKIFAERAQKPGVEVSKAGDVAASLASAAKKVEAVYEAPFLAHATMEPMNCTADVRADSCDVWASTQMQTMAQGAAAQASGLPPAKVHIHSQFMGGGFGRRGMTDYVTEAVEVSKAIGAPVKVTWSREDDTQHDNYRPASYSRFEAGLDAEGWPIAWTNRIACPSITNSSGQPPQNGIDRTSTEGSHDMGYGIPNKLVDYHWTEVGIPVTYWRAVGYTQNTFFVESFMDEVAAAGGKDPVELRRRLLAQNPRLLRVLELVAQKSEWGKPLPAGRFRGVAVVNNVGSYTAQVAEVSVNQGKVRVHRVVCAVDCGHIVNPTIVEQQIRSAIVYGLTAALKGEITISQGRVQQANFNQYDMLRIDEAPVVEVHLVESAQNPGGIGEAGVPAIAPAVCNAIFAATGKRIRHLPIRPEQLA
ncbi:MAG TPA: xanthine dehydrogenase family protein molybdopterin-binding subunit [Bryobacteraceae bacterium]|jgi:isoquinoline 1-oxidoreductase beta subunit|nr:xanthine dehydrogenase family protein molybdopterin-binding subunit [Bryobacteraceae bacterium]